MINNVQWFKIEDNPPPNDIRIITVDMNSSSPSFIDNVYYDGQPSVKSWKDHIPTHTLNFPKGE